jgi:hypothetical protein
MRIVVQAIALLLAALVTAAPIAAVQASETQTVASGHCPPC